MKAAALFTFELPIHKVLRDLNSNPADFGMLPDLDQLMRHLDRLQTISESRLKEIHEVFQKKTAVYQRSLASTIRCSIA